MKKLYPGRLHRAVGLVCTALALHLAGLPTVAQTVARGDPVLLHVDDDAPPAMPEVPEDSYAGRLLAARRRSRKKLDDR